MTSLMNMIKIRNVHIYLDVYSRVLDSGHEFTNEVHKQVYVRVRNFKLE